MALSALHRKLIEDGTKLWDDRRALESFWDESALAFWPEMANFQQSLPTGDYAAHLSSSYPVIARRTLGDSLSALLRPASLDTTSPGVWFSVRTDRQHREDHESKRWLEWATGIQRRAMYDRNTGFVRATKESDHAFVTFGQCVIAVTLNRAGERLLYRARHLKDVVWRENAEGEINHVQYRWRPTAVELHHTFGDRVAQQVKNKLRTDPYEIVECRHIVIAAEDYASRDEGGQKHMTPWVSIWVDTVNETVLEETGSWSRVYVIPRWQTLPGGQYAASPAVIAALPDARLIQAIALALQESSEKFGDPPMVATDQALRGDSDLRAGGITWVDRDYDEKTGAAIRPLYQPEWGRGLQGVFALNTDIRDMIDKAFYLDTLTMPPADVNRMTAFEVSQRINEWLRRAVPLFEPMEFDYNGQICEATFELLMRGGAFGRFSDIPPAIRNADVSFTFQSPLHENADRRKGQKFLEASALLAQAAQLDGSVVPLLDARTALRDALEGIGVPINWTRDNETMDDLARTAAQTKAMEQVMMGAAGVAETADKLGSAAKNFASANAQQPAVV